MSLKEKYLADPLHGSLRNHYTGGGYSAMHLGFTRQWAEANLPKNGEMNGFEIYLVDTEDGNKEYKTPGYVAWQGNSDLMGFMDQDWNHHELIGLQSYFYGAHHCPCHRKCDMKAYLPDLDEECEGKRFLISRICVPGEDLILYSETMSDDELELTLGREIYSETGAIPLCPP
jgi:hypothetical protein